jgi:hypothetical protein
VLYRSLRCSETVVQSTLASVMVEDPERALRFYTDKLGLVKRQDGAIDGRVNTATGSLI